MKHTHELCPHCDTEVKLQNKFELQTCPNCKSPIMPCSICEDMNCANCPLETPEYREKLIDAVMNTCYQNDDPKYDHSNRAYLETLTNMELSIKLNEYITAEL